MQASVVIERKPDSLPSITTVIASFVRQELHQSQEDSMLWLIAHTEVFFPGLLVVLILLVEFGFRIRRASPETSAEIQSAIESARDGLGVLLGLLLGFSLPMSLPHY
jgi:hypothetical protein